MPIAHVQTAGPFADDNVTTTVGRSFTNPVAPGSLVVVSCGAWDGTLFQLASVQDNQGNVYTVVNNAAYTGTGNNSAFAYCANVASNGGTFTITATAINSGTYFDWGFSEFSGVKAALPVNQFNSSSGAVAVNSAVVSLPATTVAGCLVVGLATGGTTSTPNWASPTGYTNILRENSNAAGVPIDVAYKILGSASTETLQWTHASSYSRNQAIAFEPADAKIRPDQKTSTFTESNIGTTTPGRSFTTAPTPGSCVVVLIAGFHSTLWVNPTVTDNQGNTYTVYSPGTGVNGNVAIAYAFNVASSGTFTLTVSGLPASGVYMVWGAQSFTGVATSGALCGTGGAYNPGGTTITATVTPTADDALVIGLGSVWANITWETIPNFAELFNFGNWTTHETHYSVQRALVGNSGIAQTINWAPTVSSGWASAAIALKPTATDGPVTGLTQEGFRFYVDGTEAGAVALVPQDVAAVRPLESTAIIRTLVDASSGHDAASTQFRLEYKKSTDSDWSAVGTSSSPPPTEKITNGGMDSATAWTFASAAGTAGISGGVANLHSAGSNAQLYQNIANAPAGTHLKLTFSHTPEVGSTFLNLGYVRAGGVDIVPSGVVRNAVTPTLHFPAPSANPQLLFMTWASNGAQHIIDNVSVTENLTEPFMKRAGTAVTGTAAVTPTWPTHVAGDLALLFIESTGGQAATLSTAAGFAAVSGSPASTGTTTAGTRITVFWCRATSAAMANPTVADPGDHVYAQILTFGNVVATGDPWDVTATSVKASASTTATAPSVTTTVANALIVHAIARDTDSAPTTFFATFDDYAASTSSLTNSNLLYLKKLIDGGTIDGNGGGFGIFSGIKATAGATGDTTVTCVSSINASITIALKPSAAPAAPIVLSASANIAAGGENTTARLDPPSGKTTSDFQAGRIADDENPLDAIDLATSKYTEVAWVVKPQAPAVENETYQFRVTKNGTVLDSYAVTPQLYVGTAGDLAATLDDATLAATGEVVGDNTDGTLSATLDDATLVAAATVEVVGVSAPTLDDSTLVSTATVDVVGVSAPTLDDSTLASTATVDVVGVSSVTLDDATLVSAGIAEASGELAQTLDDATVVAAATGDIAGVLAQTLEEATVVAAGTGDIAGVSSSTLDDSTLVATATAEVAGVSSVTLDEATVVAAATTETTGEFAVTLDDATATAVGVADIAGSASVQLDDATAVATGVVPITGYLGTFGGSLLLEGGDDYLLLESGDRLLLEGVPGYVLDDATLVGTGEGTLSGVADITLDDATLVATTDLASLGVGESSGAATATAVGNATKPALGASDGSATASAVGGTTVAATGASSTSAAATGVSAAVHSAVGASAGTSSAPGVGPDTTVVAAVGTASGVAAVAATGRSDFRAAGASAGTATASAAGASAANLTGVSAGAATASAVATSAGAATAAAPGSATATAVGSGVTSAQGSATGSATVVAISDFLGDFSATGSASAGATATATGGATSRGSGAAQATGSAIGQAAATSQAAGSATAAATATAAGVGLRPATGTSAGAATAAASGRAAAAAVAASTASATAVATGMGIGTGRGDTAQGQATATAVAASVSASRGSSAGSSTAAATRTAIAAAAGSASGSSAAPGSSASATGSAGSAIGAATATGVGLALSISSGSSAATAFADGRGFAQALITGEADGEAEALAVAQSQAVAVGQSGGAATANAVGDVDSRLYCAHVAVSIRSAAVVIGLRTATVTDSIRGATVVVSTNPTEIDAEVRSMEVEILECEHA